MQPPADVRAAAVAERTIKFPMRDRLNPVADDAPLRDTRIPAPVSVALRRATRRVKGIRELIPTCDVGSTDGPEALEAICAALREVYTEGRCGIVPSGAVARRVFRELRNALVDELDTVHASLKPGELGQVLRALDAVADELDRDERDRDETAQFLTALGSKDGADLVVEIAHDMRSPLTAILMLTDMLRRQEVGRGDERPLHQLGLVYSAAFGLTSLVNDAIALARGGDRLIDRQPVPFSARALMHSVADMLRPIAEERRLALRIATPSVSARIGQPVALSRVLLNLGSNALKYTNTGEVAMSASEVGRDRVRFEVTDTGPGIPADVLPGLFEPFGKRLSSSRARRFSRTGLGLAICRKLVRDMGGELGVETDPAYGTRFFFDLTLPTAEDCDISSAGAMIF
jgi:signal transduction histidine kinase